MFTVQRLDVRVARDDPDPALHRARAAAAAGDESWQQWVEEYERGEALIVALNVSVQAMDGEVDVVQARNGGVFVEKDIHPPRLERQVAEIVTKDYGYLAAELRRRGHSIEALDLADMYIHVELEPELRDALTGPGADRRTERAGAPRAEVALSRHI